MRQSDFTRGLNRARINDLFNGCPPYSAEEVEANGINVNVNYLESTRISHDARTQFYGAMLKPGNYFKATTDMGPQHKQAARSAIVTKEMNRIMKRSLRYFECFRSKFALDVLHGIGPSGWEDQEHWCPDAIDIADVMVPSNTLLTLKNLPFIAIYRSFTARELIKLTRGPRVDPAWNKPLVEACIEWIDKETTALMGSNWPEVWSPEKAAERVKGDGGFYVGDQVPTIDTWDFYFWDDSGKHSGWKRRMILDSWSTPAATGTGYQMSQKTGDAYKTGKGQFLYNPKDRVFADNLSNIVTFQFADLSSVAPFRYHSVRSLGFLLYAVCHLQNRLRCKFNESVFESLMMYFRVKTMEDVQRALKVELANKGFIDDAIQFIPAAERFQVNSNLVELGLRENAGIIQSNSSSYTTNPDKADDSREKTAFQVMSEMNSMTSLVSAALMQAYSYQTYEYREIFRRFCRKGSTDPDVIKFRGAVLKQGVPENMLREEAWDLEPERVMGGGNKSLEMAIAQQLMQYRNLYDPEPQRQILRDVTLAITDDPARADQLVPEEQQKVTDAVHDAQLAAGSLMMGLPVAVKTGINHIDYVEAMTANMAIIIQKAMQSGGMATPDQITGLQNMAQNISQHIEIIAQDESQKDLVKKFNDQLSKLMNLVKAFAQRLQEQMKKQAQQNGKQGDPAAMAKIQATMMQAKAKMDNTRESHAARTAQRQLSWEREEMMKQKQTQAEIARENMRTAAEISNSRLKALSEPKAPKKD